MNYKKLIKSRELRIKILNLLNWVPDSIMIPLQYWIHTGRKLNMKNPKRFTEKLQLYKLKYHNKEMLRCTDKYTVRDFVKEKGLEDILIPLIGIYSSTDEVDFDSLPSQFVAKTTDGGGGNQIFICKDKSTIDKDFFFTTLLKWMSGPKTKKSAGREWAYQNGLPRRILIEKLLTNPGHSDIPDYKFFCFDGKVGFVYGVSDRVQGQAARIGIYTPEWKKLDVVRNDELHQDKALPIPLNYTKMVKIAEFLSKEFPEVRVDLYNINGKIYFGEMTFYDGSGYMTYNPDKYDEIFGSYFNIDSFISK